MFTIGFSTKNIDEKFIDHLRNTCGPKNVEIIPFENKGTHSLSEAYNSILEQSSNDIVVLCHDDIYFEKKGWGNKLLKHFNKNTDYGILGVAGSLELPKSAKWWENPKKMRGIVNHEHEGRKWESRYSSSLGNKIEETALVDGLFIAVHKKRIKTHFNTDVKGFHMYDVSFCAENFLKDVKIGVIYDIRITHLSIGQTNDEWERNRENFSKKYESELPIKVFDRFENRKFKVLLGVLNFNGLTGSEVSTLELAKGLSSNNCDVSVISTSVSEKFRIECNKHNIKTYTTQNPPGFAIGDGNSILNTPNGPQRMEKGRLYKIGNVSFDMIQTNHKPITDMLLNLYPENKFVTVVRSEIIDLENPVVDDKVIKYIAIRPSIKEYLTTNFEISEDNIEVIYNPFDSSKFKPISNSVKNDKEKILFVGTMDYLRKSPIEDLIQKVKDEDKILQLVGKDTMGYAKEYSDKYDFVEYYPPNDKIENFYNHCDVTAGIMLGRTTIEGFLCEKPAWVYNVDKSGNILGKDFYEVPDNLEVFDRDYSVNKFKETYLEVYNS